MTRSASRKPRASAPPSSRSAFSASRPQWRAEAGWLFSFLGVVSPGQFDWSVSLNILVMVLIGGINTTLGPVIGAAFVSMFPALVNINPWLQEMVYGALSILAVTLLPGGVMSLLRMRRPCGRAFNAGGRRLQLQKRRRQEPLEASLFRKNSPATKHGKSGANVADPDICGRCRNIGFNYPDGPSVLRDVNLAGQARAYSWPYRPKRVGQEHARQCHRRALAASCGNGSHQQCARRWRAAAEARQVGHAPDLSGGGTCARTDAWPERHGRPFQLEAPHRRARRNLAAPPLRAPRYGVDEWPLAGRSADGWRRKLGRDVKSATCRMGSSNSPSWRRCASLLPTSSCLTSLRRAYPTREVDHLAEILAHLKAQGVTMIIIEHQTRFLFPLCDQVTVLNTGEIIFTGTADEVRADPVVRQVYLGG